ncbi:MAG: hypothetical protein JXB05_16320, partial [Myxococcaceae bacterium]|nr:hypothetical protein [Myxococcaceae bacterium]
LNLAAARRGKTIALAAIATPRFSRIVSTLEPRPSLAIQAGDVLITRAGPRSRVGICCLVRQVRPRLMLCDKAYRIRPTAELLGSFLEMLLASPRLIDELEKLKSGISDSGVNLTQDRFLQLRLPVPPLSEQRLILDHVAARLSVIGSIESSCLTTHQRAARLRQAVLSSAFAGSLAPQDPNDEPASKLLERISAAVENKPLPKQGRAKQVTAVPKMKATR